MDEVLHMINEMSPYLLLGFLFAGILHSFVPAQFYSRYLAGADFRSVLYAAMMGVPLPLCSCGVLPTAMSLHKEGASKGATTSFLIATPQTGVDSIAATYSLMGLAFAVIRPIAALVTALFGGVLTNAFTRNDKDDTMTDAAQPVEGCYCHDNAKDVAQMSFIDKCIEALRYAYIDMISEIGKWLVIGLVIAALITVFVPNDFFAVFAGNSWLSMLLVLLISVPMYICATGSIPIAVALMLKGLSPGTALVMLMAGPAANVASILVIRNQLGTRALLAYLLSIIGGAVGCGLIIDYLLPAEWFSLGLIKAVDCCEEPTWFQWACTAVLGVLLLIAVCRQLMGNKPSCPHCASKQEGDGDCCCHHETKKDDGDCCCHHETKKDDGECCCHHHEKR